LDSSKNIIGRLCPSERFGIFVDDVEIVENCLFQFRRGTMDTSAQLVVGQQREEPLDLVDPGSGGRREMDMPARAFGEPVSDLIGFVGGVIVHDDVDVEIVGHAGLDAVKEGAEFTAR